MRLTRIKALLLSLTSTLLLIQGSAFAEARYYPAGAPQPLQVGGEEFMENYASLAGLEGVRVETKFVFSSAKKYKLNDMPTDLVPQIRERLDAVGLRMLSEEELKTTPGQPVLTIYPAYTGGEIDKINAALQPEDSEEHSKKDDDSHLCCRSSIWASFQQSSAILRDPDTQFRFSTWGAGDDTEDCENRGQWTYDAVLATIDLFIADYTKAQDERQPKLVATAEDVPEACSQTWLMNLSVFDTDKTVITESVKPILDQLAETAERCENYSYTIETHADKRADEAYNKVLSEARAHAIKDYLLQRNVAYNRLKTIAFGESRPLTDGDTEADHAVNRRVVIIPNRVRS